MPVRREPAGLRTFVAIAACLMGLLLGGCSGEEEPAASPSASLSASPSASGPEGSASGGGRLPIEVGPGRVTGRLRPAVARGAVAQVGRVVDGWFEAAYLRGPWPRQSYADAFPGFTQGAVRAARQDRQLMSNVAIARDVESVTARFKKVEVDLLGVESRPVGATARFRLVFATSGAYRGLVAVAGRLLLTRTAAGWWRVFGYEMRRASTGGAAQPAEGGQG